MPIELLMSCHVVSWWPTELLDVYLPKNGTTNCRVKHIVDMTFVLLPTLATGSSPIQPTHFADLIELVEEWYRTHDHKKSGQQDRILDKMSPMHIYAAVHRVRIRLVFDATRGAGVPINNEIDQGVTM
jgi:hypothetical protein